MEVLLKMGRFIRWNTVFSWINWNILSADIHFSEGYKT